MCSSTARTFPNLLRSGCSANTGRSENGLVAISHKLSPSPQSSVSTSFTTFTSAKWPPRALSVLWPLATTAVACQRTGRQQPGSLAIQHALACLSNLQHRTSCALPTTFNLLRWAKSKLPLGSCSCWSRSCPVHLRRPLNKKL